MSAVRTTCPYCGVGCGLIAERAGSDAAVTVRPDPEHPANRGRICSKGAALAETLGLEGRLLHPRVRGEPVSWDAALDEVAKGFERTIERHGPDAVAFYVSGQLLTEDYYVANKLMKGYIGSANIDTNSRLCMASSVAGYKRAFGADLVPNVYEDLERAELLVVVGANVAWCHPVLFQRISAAKSSNPRMKVIVIDPRRTATCELADLHLKIAPGSDVVLLNGLLHYLQREGALDLEFLERHVEGFATALRTAAETAPSIPMVAAACRVAESDVAELFRAFARTDRTVTLFSQGVNQSVTGTDKVNAIVNVHLATGRIGKPGAGPFSLTGQPNAMGGREVGALANQLAAHMDFAPENVDRVRRFWTARRVADRPGLTAVELFAAVAAGKIKALWIMATNPAVSMPDARAVRAALERCDLVVVSDCVPDTDTVRAADVLLPAATWGEKSGTVTNSERRISRQRAFLPPPGEARPDWWIICEVAKRMGHGAAFDYSGPAAIFREHAALSAFENDGTRDFDLGPLARLSDAEYEALLPVQWPLPATMPSRPFADGRFFTPSRKARLVATVPRSPPPPDERHPLVLNTGRVRDQWHTMTRTGRVARLAGHSPEPFVQLHPVDAAKLGVTYGDLVAVTSPTGSGRLLARAAIVDDVSPGQVFAPMHWSDAFARDARVGELIPSEVDPVSRQPQLKYAAVRVERYVPRWYGFALTREPVRFRDCSYVARSRGEGHWRYELAGETLPASWREWAADVLGPLAERIELHDPAGGRYRGARVVEDRLQACVFVAPTHRLPARGWIGELFVASPIDEAGRIGILAGRPPKGRGDTGPVVCSCFSVGRAALLRAIRTQSLVTTADIGRVLRAGTNCGSCLPELRGLLAEAAALST